MGSAGKRNYSVVHFKGKSPEVDRERAYRKYLREKILRKTGQGYMEDF